MYEWLNEVLESLEELADDLGMDVSEFEMV